MDSQVVIKIKDGTRSDSGELLCWSCRHSTVLRGSTASEEAIYCGQIGRKIPIKPVECNRYDSKNTPTLYEMESIAWLLLTKSAGRKIGFESPQERAGRQGNYPSPPSSY